MISQSRIIKLPLSLRTFSNLGYSSYFTGKLDELKNNTIDITQAQLQLALESGIDQAINALNLIEKQLNTLDKEVVTTVTLNTGILQITFSSFTNSTKSTAKKQ
ncbi:MAG: hypothetical protein Barrevirus1_21 [Barrevirus sp.]|uniref:Uncharacterized protein n=1 Tax=Barrevirus sp. TaxID=2487763 RepID=A0A3G4ZTQ1_9VIRU|nr:MAG: hypothetical protein Barrevirus1_21 [Barrevirus sp.]